MWLHSLRTGNKSNNNSRNREKWPAFPYSSGGTGSGVVLRHRASAAARVCLTVDAAAAYYTPGGGSSPD